MPSYAQETGVIKVGTLAKIRRLYFRDKQSIKEICRQTGMSRNTVRAWLRDPEMVEPKYPARVVVSKLGAYTETLSLWLKADSRRGRAAGAQTAQRPVHTGGAQRGVHWRAGHRQDAPGHGYWR